MVARGNDKDRIPPVEVTNAVTKLANLLGFAVSQVSSRIDFDINRDRDRVKMRMK